MIFEKKTINSFAIYKKYKRKIATFKLNSKLEKVEYFLPLGNLQSYGEICIPESESYGVCIDKKIKTIQVDTNRLIVKVSSNIEVNYLLKYLEKFYKCYLRVLPGAAVATVGGCIAADVHGKSSHKYGSFGDHIISITLIDINTHKLTKITSEDNLFAYTIGGFGATGLIIEAELKIYEMPGTSIIIDSLKINSHEKLISKLIEYSNNYDEVGVWFSIQKDNFLSKIIYGKWCDDTSKNKKSYLKLLKPIIFLILGNINVYKKAYKFISQYIYNQNNLEILSQNDATFPLSHTKGWEKLFGNSLVERQFLIKTSLAEDFFTLLIILMRDYEINSPFCAIKVFNGNRIGLMSFAQEGVAFNILYRSEQRDFSNKLSALLVKFNAPEYLAKCNKEHTTFPNGYFNFEQWMILLEKNKIKSQFFN